MTWSEKDNLEAHGFSWSENRPGRSGLSSSEQRPATPHVDEWLDRRLVTWSTAPSSRQRVTGSTKYNSALSFLSPTAQLALSLHQRFSRRAHVTDRIDRDSSRRTDDDS